MTHSQNPIWKLLVGTVLVSVVLSAVMGYFLFGSSGQSQQSQHTSGTVENYPTWYVNGIRQGTMGLFHIPVQTVIGAGSNDATWLNNTGKTVYIDYGQTMTTGVASSSFKIYVFATSTATISPAHYSTAIGYDATSTPLINGITIATSTFATTTNSTMAAAKGVGNGTIVVPSGWYVHTYLQAVDAPGCGGTGACEQSTSTNRGIGTITTWLTVLYPSTQ